MLDSPGKSSSFAPKQTSSSQKPAKNSPGPTGRKHLRTEGELRQVILSDPRSAKELGEAQVYDYSLGGLALFFGQPITKERVLNVGIPHGPKSKKEDALHWVLIQVKYCRKTTQGWVIGGEFIQPSKETFEMLKQVVG